MVLNETVKNNYWLNKHTPPKFLLNINWATHSRPPPLNSFVFAIKILLIDLQNNERESFDVIITITIETVVDDVFLMIQ